MYDVRVSKPLQARVLQNTIDLGTYQMLLLLNFDPKCKFLLQIIIFKRTKTLLSNLADLP